ncbi:MAG: hypothetical protein ABJE66_26330 [Deltaproteobacteria bacterium]
MSMFAENISHGRRAVLQIVALALACAGHGCKHVDETKIAGKAACAVIVKAIAVNGGLLAGVTQRLKDTDRALEMADRWSRKQVTDAEDGSELFSGAAKRATMHAGAALALCQSAQELHAAIEKMAALIHEPAIHVDERTVYLDCSALFLVDTAGGASRDKVAVDLEGQTAGVQLAETRYRDTCKTTFGVEDATSVGPVGGVAEPK